MTAETVLSASSFVTPPIDHRMWAGERVAAAYRRIAACDRPEIWITLRPQADVAADAATVDHRTSRSETLPLAGMLLAVKDNVDVAGLPTTAGCPEFAYVPDRTAPAVQRLLDAGAIVIGKTNLDQFATGLVGTRSPYGAVRCAWDAERISGGSSSGSAAAVGLGLVDLAIGTDTAGSGRVPAAFQGIVGVKPTLGIVPATGVVPACADYDAVTVLAADLKLASRALALMAGRDGDGAAGTMAGTAARAAGDPRGRSWPVDVPFGAPGARPMQIAVPHAADLEPLTPEYRVAFAAATERLRSLGALVTVVRIDELLSAARLLYDGAVVAERYAAVGAFLETAPAGADPVVSRIILDAGSLPAHQLVDDQERLRTASNCAAALLRNVDALMVPATTEHPRLSDVVADPIGVNTRLGTYTNFCNLLDLAAVAVPAGVADGGPFGVMFVVPAFADQVALDVAGWFIGSTPPDLVVDGGVDFVAVGAHMRGQPLARQLDELGARYLGDVTTSDAYRLYALDTVPAKPGLVRLGPGLGVPVAGERWRVSTAGLGSLLSTLPAPMGLTKVELSDGSWVVSFACSAESVLTAQDISSFGDWRRFRASVV